MATRRAGTGDGTASAVIEESGLKLVRLELTPDVHKDFRVEAAREGLSMAAMARRLVEDWTSKRKAGGK